MVALKRFNGSQWVDVFAAVAAGNLDARLWAYHEYDDAYKHSVSTRSFTLNRLNHFGFPNTAKRDPQYFRLFFRIGNPNSLPLRPRVPTQRTASITVAGRTISRALNNNDLPLHNEFVAFGALNPARIPTGDRLTVTTTFPVPRTEPSLYAFAIGMWN